MSIKRNAFFNFAGGVVPALVTLFTIPLIVRGLGSEGYGLFTLITAIVGYFALIDINVTAGSVKYIAEYAAKDDQPKINQSFSFGLLIYFVIGACGAGGIFFGSSFLARSLFQIETAQLALAEHCLQIAALGFFFGQLQQYLQSVPQALLRYDVTSRLEMLFGTSIPILTIVLLNFGFGLTEIIWLRVLASLVNCVLLAREIRQLQPALKLTSPSRDIAVGLVNFSAYSFLSRLAGLTYAHADKLIIGAALGLKELAYYSVAATLANRVLGMTYRISSVLFPSASAMAAKGETESLRRIYLKVNRYVCFLNGSVLILVAVFAEPILRYWMSPEFAAHGALILAIVACAQFVDSLTNLPSLVNDGLGHPRISGSFALGRALIGIAAVAVLVKFWGITGVALAHLMSSVLMTTLFIIFVHGRTVPCSLRELFSHSYARPAVIIAMVAAITTTLVIVTGSQLLQVAVAMMLAALLCLALGLRYVVMPDDRAAIYMRLNKLGLKPPRI